MAIEFDSSLLLSPLTKKAPRLTAVWKKGFLNGRLLPMYGRTGVGVEFDYTSPVPEDKEARDRNLVASSTAYKNFVDAGVDGSDEAMLRHLGLPAMKQAPKPEPPPAPAPPAPVLEPEREPEEEPPDDDPEARLHRRDHLPRAVLDVRDAAGDDAPDLSGVLDDLDRQLKRLEDDYVSVRYDQVDSLVAQVEAAVDDDDLDALVAVAVPASLRGADLVERALVGLATTASERATDEVVGDVALDPDDVAGEVESMSELGGVA